MLHYPNAPQCHGPRRTVPGPYRGRTRCDRRAFTLVELLVVIAIISMLVALLLPAVQAAREAARRLSCLNNMANLAIAVSGYEMAFEVYPPGTIEAKGPILQTPAGYHHNWLIQILPYMEEQNTYRSVDFKVGVYHKNNAPVMSLALPPLQCSSNPFAVAGSCSYAGNHHHAEAPIDVTNTGVFYLNSSVRTRDISDGLSHTLLLSEINSSPFGWMSGTRSTLRNTGVPPNNSAMPVFRGGGAAGAAPMSIDEALELGADLLDRQGGAGEGQDPVSVPSGLPAAAGPVGGYYSSHPGGVNIVMGDGHTQFLTNTVAPKPFQQMGHRADGLLITDRNY